MSEPLDVLSVELSGSLSVEASAGTGKTWSLIRLALRLIVERDVPISQLLAVTFTNAAADELSERLREGLREALRALETEEDNDFSGLIAHWRGMGLSCGHIGTRLEAAHQDSDRAQVSTIHVFCQNLLRESALTRGRDHHEGGEGDPNLLDIVTQDFLRLRLPTLSDPAERARLLARYQDLRDALAYIDELSLPLDRLDLEFPPEAWEEEPFLPALLRDFARWAPERLWRIRDRAGTASFSDLIRDTVAATDSLDFVKLARSKFRAALIDEVQDTDIAQHLIFRRLLLADDEESEARFVAFVGDAKQSIYRFRGSDLDSYRELSAATDRRARLDTNYRAAPDLTRAINAFFGDEGDQQRCPFLNDLRYEPVKPNDNAKVGSVMLGDWKQPVFELWAALYPSTEEADEAEADRVARDIALLRGYGTIDGRPARLSDVAILVSQRKHAKKVTEALSRFRLPFVELNTGGDDQWWDELSETRLVLRALADPLDDGSLARARATRLFGRQLHELSDQRALVEDRTLLDEMGALFTKGGPASALDLLFERRQALSRLLTAEHGERRWRYCRHIAAQLQAAWRQFPTLAGLIGLLGRTLKEKDESWGRRKESALSPPVPADPEAVTISTIHGSKGLEYPIVYLVGASRLTNGKKKTRDGLTPLSFARHHQDQRVAVVIRPGEDPAEAAEEAQEAVRLAYVAMTRASRRLVVPLLQRAKDKSGAEPSHHRASNAYFMSLGAPRGSTKFDPKVILEALSALEHRLRQEFGGDREKSPVHYLIDKRDHARDPVPTRPPLGAEEDDGPPAADSAERHDPAVAISSFTGITRGREEDLDALASEEVSLADRADDDPDPDEPSPEDGPGDAPPLSLPAGTRTGLMLHEVMERVDLSCPDKDASVISRTLDRYPELLPGEGADTTREDLTLEIAGLIDYWRWVELVPGVRLGDVPRSACVTEWPFTISTPGDRMRYKRHTWTKGVEVGLLAPPDSRLTSEGLMQLLSHFDRRYHMPGLRPQRLNGYLSGTADLVFESQGKIWLVDWKSNLLGQGRPEDYGPEALAEAMRQHGYQLQYLLYLLALYRFLSQSKPDGKPWEYLGDAWERLGGACYVFLRGRQPPGRPPAVVFDRPPRDLIMALDAYFYGGPTAPRD